MKKRRTLIVTLLLVAVLALGVGYAAVSDAILTITGTGDLTTSDENFKVVFTNPVSATGANISVDTGAPQNASIAVTGLKSPEDTVTVYIDILNDQAAGSLYAAAISGITIVQDTGAYFKATVVNEAALETTVLQPGEDVTVEIEIELLKVPTDPNATYTGHFTIDFTATPQTATPGTP